MPVPPTTNAHTSVTMPSRLCRSSHFTRLDRSRRTSPNASLRMNGAYSTTPVTMATSSKQAHEAEEKLARQTRKQVHMQTEHHVHETLVHGPTRQHFGRTRIHSNRLEVFGGRGGGRERDEPHVGIVVGLRRELHHALGVQCMRSGKYLVQTGARRVGRHGGRFDLGAQQVADFVVKDQRQAREAQQQHENGAHQAGPLVGPAPAAQGGGAQHVGTGVEQRLQPRRTTPQPAALPVGGQRCGHAAEAINGKEWFKPGNPKTSEDGGCWLQTTNVAVACGNRILHCK